MKAFRRELTSKELEKRKKIDKIFEGRKNKTVNPEAEWPMDAIVAN